MRSKLLAFIQNQFNILHLDRITKCAHIRVIFIGNLFTYFIIHKWLIYQQQCLLSPHENTYKQIICLPLMSGCFVKIDIINFVVISVCTYILLLLGWGDSISPWLAGHHCILCKEVCKFTSIFPLCFLRSSGLFGCCVIYAHMFYYARIFVRSLPSVCLPFIYFFFYVCLNRAHIVEFISLSL